MRQFFGSAQLKNFLHVNEFRFRQGKNYDFYKKQGIYIIKHKV